MNCPKCQNLIASENINVKTDLCICQKCNSNFKLSELINPNSDNKFDLQNSPKGTWYSRHGNNITIGASTKSWIAFFLVPFLIVWSGGSIGGIYGSQIYNGEFNPIMSLFGLPFLIGSIIFWSMAIMTIAGKTEVIIDNSGGQIFTGFINWGFKKRFNWNEISEINEQKQFFNFPGSGGGMIRLEGAKRITFGRLLNEERRYYMFKAIQTKMYQGRTKGHYV